MNKGAFAVNEYMQTSDPDIYAIGDVCAFPSQGGDLVRCEHVDHARKSAAQAVKAAMELEPAPYKYLPYFYSRVFEYTDAPLVFNFFGDSVGECKVRQLNTKTLSATWTSGVDGSIRGALLMGSPGPTAEDQAELRDLIGTMPEVAKSS